MFDIKDLKMNEIQRIWGGRCMITVLCSQCSGLLHNRRSHRGRDLSQSGREEDPGRLPGRPVMGSESEKGEEGTTSPANRVHPDMEWNSDMLWSGKQRLVFLENKCLSESTEK